MDLESATEDLYRVAPAEFTSTRDAMAVQARQAGQQELASSLRKLRKPSVGAWLANLLVLEQSSDVRRLVDLGAELRAPNRQLEGEQIRRVSKERSVAVSGLVRDAKSRASRLDQPVSRAASEELEATLEAAFADPKAAESLLRGRLNKGLHYSGLGFDAQASPGVSGSRTASRRADRTAAKRNLEKASNEAQRADAQMEKTSQAVTAATQELTRLKSAKTVAIRHSKEAHAKVSAAKKALGALH